MNRRRKKRKGLIRSVLALICLAGLVMGLMRLYEQYRYPLAYQQIMEEWAEEYDVPKDLAAAVICAESRFQPDVVSQAGAVGLMQLLPETAEWIAGKLELSSVPTAEDLMEPEVNIRLGIWYLAYLLNRFDGREVLALAAYNAGPTRVTEWLASGSIREEDPDTIPYAETRKYVIVVEETRSVYRERYGLGV